MAIKYLTLIVATVQTTTQSFLFFWRLLTVNNLSNLALIGIVFDCWT